MLALPKTVQAEPQWQTAAKVLHQAAEHGGPFVFIARISFAKAVFGDNKQHIGNSEGKKSHKWRSSRKLARDR